jgi:Glycosyl hydrolase family 79 C-terminal beta domain
VTLATLLLAGVLAVILAVALATGDPSAPTTGAQSGQAGPVKATITLGAGTVRLPRSFFGLSIEYSELPMFERFRPAFERFLSLVHISGDGPQVIRIGGDSADLTFWNPGSQSLPPRAFVLTDRWFRQTAGLVRQMRLRLLLDLGLRHSTAAAAARQAAAAQARLPGNSIAGFEIGNEPDHYGNGYSIADYVRDFRAYEQALARVAPAVPVLGPAITRVPTDTDWLRAVLTGDHPQLGVLTGHRYPLGACAQPGQALYPTVPKLLSESVSAGLAQSVRPAVLLAHAAKRAFRLDEFNSVTCGGRLGVSNTFATALWAPDALFELLQTGIDAVNLHIRSTKINGPLALAAQGLKPRPLLYGLILFARVLSPGGRMVRLAVHVPSSTDLKAWAARIPGNVLHVLLIDKSRRRVNVDLRLPASASATVQRLLAPSVSSTRGVTLAGQHLGPDGRWRGRPVIETVAHRAGGYRVSVPGYSAAMFSVKLR